MCEQSPFCQTVNLAKLTTENEVYNKVPEQATMLIDIRYNAKTNIQFVYDYLDKCDNLKYFVYAKANPFYVNINNEIIQKYINVCKQILSNDIEIIECHSASDARFFSERGIPVVMMNPQGQEMHGINEAINIDSFDKILKIYQKYVEVI